MRTSPGVGIVGGLPAAMEGGGGAKKARSKRRFRKRQRAPDSDDEDGGGSGEGPGKVGGDKPHGGGAVDGAGEAGALAGIRALRTGQKLRRRRGGLDTSALARGDQLDQTEEGGEEAGGGSTELDTWGAQDERKKLDQMLSGAFTATTKAPMKDDTESEQLQAYLRSKLGGQAEGPSSPVEKGNGAGDASSPPGKAVTSTATTDADVAPGGALLHGTGMAEVALPVEFKLANIEATERARQEMLLRGGGRGGGGGGYSGRGRGRKGMSSDFMVMSRFRKRHPHRR